MKIYITSVLMLIVMILAGCTNRSLDVVEQYDMRDVNILPDNVIVDEDAGNDTADISDIHETPLRLIFEADNSKPGFGEVALLPSLTEEKTLVINMMLGGDDTMKLTFYGVYYRISFPDDTLEVETVSAHPELPAGIINKFTVRKGEIIGVITNKGEAPMFSLGCNKPLISVRFKIKMIRAGRVDIVTSRTQILDDKLKPVVNNYFGGKLSIIQK